jgi:hypothetical protein
MQPGARGDLSVAFGGEPVVRRVDAGPRPTPAPRVADDPLGRPPAVRADGSFAFIATQGATDDPVTYDPCRPIAVVVDGRSAPPGAERLLDEALDEVTEATGLRFVIEGSSTEPPRADRPPFDEERYGDRWSPVLVSWTDPDQVPELSGQVAGIGGSSSTFAPGSDELVYVSGLVALDAPDLLEVLARPEGEATVRGIIVHELAHLVGLGHVDDETQLMHDRGQMGIDSLQQGDRAGLAQLGAGPCFDEL